MRPAIITSGMVNSKSLPERPSRPGTFACGRSLSGWSSVTDTISAFGSSGHQGCCRPPIAVKLRIANVGLFPHLGRSCAACHPHSENTAKINIFSAIAMFPRRAPNASPKIDENQSLPYKPRQLSADGPVSCRGGSVGAVNGPFWAGYITGRDLIQQANLPRSAENDP